MKIEPLLMSGPFFAKKSRLTSLASFQNEKSSST